MESPKFRYTKDNDRLTFKERLFYEKNGYLLIPDLIPQSIRDKCSQRFDDIVSGKVERGMITVMRDIVNKKQVNKIQDINHDDIFREYFEYDKILDIVECFTGPNIMALHSMLIAKPPDAGLGSSEHPPHQDLYYFPFRPADKIVASWTAIEPCDKVNGCLYVYPGSHTLDKLYPHNYPVGSKPNTVNKFYHGINEYLPGKKVYLPMKPGDTVVFHPLLIHGSGINQSKRTRKAISCHYASSDCYYVKPANEVEKLIQDEIEEVVRKKYNANLNYIDFWSFKSSLVRGKRCSL
ncbi:PREDICTED: phytanoyl-CoA dioxygenase, peroxisomal-like [Polistes dominula]|uniref:phytanoyl-CoA dioxygenase n=1 Tax=Polistes dominula TaxID=743375 RepID=A0ABM1I643_POLDO|nr:PREDICTED: phytanoyl-CoA dioxygenase, peroxisomal-like [Polistes dominula]XP_015175681.1 PREDICTED: phytanoyl-CoA dioxygenase, peroxisomal-like [Polistes dominula]